VWTLNDFQKMVTLFLNAGVSSDLPVVAPSPEAVPLHGLTPRPLFSEDTEMKDREARITDHRIRQSNAEVPVLPRSFVQTMAMSERPIPVAVPQRRPEPPTVMTREQAASLVAAARGQQSPVRKPRHPDELSVLPEGTAFPIQRKRA
jgi:hypothetical protein